ncbi:hypothetical protein [Desulfovibrio gilichinskyi]|uniref:Uncharacterized protein n=1 Tax=Desulfovibrio gilichinskyi TaxID=1519643 RepID=A0A1X7CHE0_9BACT|nr:hypothetical protein [Desulfovibrio gilichinskyi]SME96139.1 hypothetical protein SAMN06295933_0865 [Desulfovibrio gilichinskyi]
MTKAQNIPLAKDQVGWLKRYVNCTNFIRFYAKSVSISKVFDEDKRGPDCWRYTVKDGERTKAEVRESGTLDTLGSCNVADYCCKDGNVILLLLEFPHYKEYDGLDPEGMRPIAPAQGSTGSRIRNQLIKKLESCNLETGKEYHVVISNPVQFQASLYSLHGQSTRGNIKAGSLRDAVWKALMVREKNNFIERLKSYDPVIIINACTKGVTEDVDCLVYEFFFNARKNNVKLPRYFHSSAHPSSWDKYTTIEEL